MTDGLQDLGSARLADRDERGLELKEHGWVYRGMTITPTPGTFYRVTEISPDGLYIDFESAQEAIDAFWDSWVSQSV